jgi:hypothetical protein
LVQSRQNVVTEKRTVHAHLDNDSGRPVANRLNTGQNEILGSTRIVHISLPVHVVKQLPGLGDRAKQRVVAAGSLFPIVQPNSHALGLPLGGLGGTTEVQRY